MRKLAKIMLPEVGVGNLKIRSRGDNRCESANSSIETSVAGVKTLHFLQYRTSS